MRGSSSVNVEPLSSPVLSANTRPPCALGDRAHDVEAEAGALDLRAARLEAVEAIEDAAELRAWECRRRHP